MSAIDLNDLAPFNPDDPHDKAADAERREVGLFIARRMSKAGKRHAELSPSAQTSAVLIGSLMAAIGAFRAAAGSGPMTEEAKEAVRHAVEFGFVFADGLDPADRSTVQ